MRSAQRHLRRPERCRRGCTGREPFDGSSRCGWVSPGSILWVANHADNSATTDEVERARLAQRTRSEGGHLGVEIGRDPRHLGLRQKLLIPRVTTGVEPQPRVPAREWSAVLRQLRLGLGEDVEAEVTAAFGGVLTMEGTRGRAGREHGGARCDRDQRRQASGGPRAIRGSTPPAAIPGSRRRSCRPGCPGHQVTTAVTVALADPVRGPRAVLGIVSA